MILAQTLALALSPEELKVFVAAVTIVMLGVGVVKLLLPIAQGFGRRLAAKDGDVGVRRELDELRERVADLETREGRMLEVEERLDFAERLLARSRERSLEDSDTPPEALPVPR